VRRFIAGFAAIALSATALVACGGDNNEAIAPDFPTFNGQTWCVYPQGAREACRDAKGGDDKPILEDHWKQASEPTRSYNAGGNYDNDMEIFFWLWMMGHMGYYNSPTFINHYHMDSGYQSRVGGYQSKYSSTISQVESNSKYSNYKSSNGKTYTGKDVATKKGLKDRLSNDRRNKPLSCSAGPIESRVELNLVAAAAHLPQGNPGPSKPKSNTNKPKPNTGKSNNNPGKRPTSGSNNKPSKPKKPSGC